MSDSEQTFLTVPGPCDLRCAWCNARGLAPLSFDGEVEQIAERLSELAARGERAVGFGLYHSEPMTYPRFPELVRRARSLGFERITLSSSGIRLSEGDLARRVVEAGVTSVILSLVTLDREISDALLGREGATEAKLAALERCLDAGARVTAILMLLRPALRGTPEAARALTDRAARAGGALKVHGCLMDRVADMPAEQEALLWPAPEELRWVVDRTRARVPGFAFRPEDLGIAGVSPQEPPGPRPEELVDALKRVGLRQGRPLWQPGGFPAWQAGSVGTLAALRRRRASIRGLRLGEVRRGATELRVSLGTGEERLEVIIERRDEAERWFLAGRRLAISAASDTPADTPAKRQALAALLTLLERAT